MPNYEARKRLKKKMLDRWENEGGKIVADSTTADSDPAKSPKDERNRQRASHHDSIVGAPPSRAKRQRPTGK